MESARIRHGLLGWFIRHKQRIGTIAVGHAAKRVEEYLFDWLIYAFVVYQCTSLWGTYWGSIAAFFIMAPLSALVCWLYLLFYDWAKKDWFGFELLKELREEEAQSSWFRRLMIRIARWGDLAAFIALSIHDDPFMVTVYLRKKGHEHRGLSRRDWNIFWLAVVFSNAYWTLRWTVIVTVIEFLWRIAPHSLVAV
jgi:hypothetical protein